MSTVPVEMGTWLSGGFEIRVHCPSSDGTGVVGFGIIMFIVMYFFN